MIQASSIPAGLLDDDIEFFNHPDDPEKCYCLTEGRVYRVNEAPERVMQIVDADIAAHPEKLEGLVILGYNTVEAQREKYCSCCFGAFDGTPDVIEGVFLHDEYWPCPQRGICPVEGMLCDGLLVGDGNALTRREIDILTLVVRGYLDKEIAGLLSISERTVKVHLKNIREKSGLMNKKDLIILAHKKNLHMNTALKTQTPGQLAPVLNVPDLQADRYVINSQEMTIADYNRYRSVIYDKLSGWLKQREYALRQFDQARAKKAQTLLMLLGVYEKATLQNICRFVVKNTESFAELAPGAKSRFYDHYQNKVMAIINLCKQQVAA